MLREEAVETWIPNPYPRRAIRFETATWYLVLIIMPAMLYLLAYPFPAILQNPALFLGLIALAAIAVFQVHRTNGRFLSEWRPEEIALSEEGIRCRYWGGRERVISWRDIRDVRLAPGTPRRETQAVLIGHDLRMMNDPALFEEAAEAVKGRFDEYRARTGARLA